LDGGNPHGSRKIIQRQQIMDTNNICTNMSTGILSLMSPCSLVKYLPKFRGLLSYPHSGCTILH